MVAEEIGLAYSVFVERVAAAVADDRITEQIAAAYGQYAALANQAQPAASHTAFESYRALLHNHLSPDPIRVHVLDAFRRFTLAAAAAWVDPPMDPAEVAAAAEAMQAAAWLATVASGTDLADDVPVAEAEVTMPGAADHDPAAGKSATGTHLPANSELVAAASAWGPTTVLE